MKLRNKISIVVGLLFVAGISAYLLGFIPVPNKDAHPPCEKLPNLEEAKKALSEQDVLSNDIKNLGEDITVEAENPCSADQSKGLVVVKYDSRKEREAISELLSNSNGFGVPVYLVKR